MRIRWRSAARIGAALVVVAMALRVGPGLLATPAPPPLAADVGLRGVGRSAPVAAVPRPRPEPVTGVGRAQALGRVELLSDNERKLTRRPAADVISSVPAPPPPAPEAAPIAPAPTPSPPPAPSPGDGSQEFAPR